MKNYVLIILSLFLVLACEKESDTEQMNEQQLQQSNQPWIKNSSKINVCHNGHLINVNINAIPAHRAHGDAIDLDGDGYFNQENVCSSLVDCNDENPDIQDTFAWAGEGIDTNGNTYDMTVHMACDFSAGTVDYGICTGSLTLVSQVGTVYTYSETVTSGCIDNCTVIMEVLANGSLSFTEDCSPDGILSAILLPF